MLMRRLHVAKSCKYVFYLTTVTKKMHNYVLLDIENDNFLNGTELYFGVARVARHQAQRCGRRAALQFSNNVQKLHRFDNSEHQTLLILTVIVSLRQMLCCTQINHCCFSELDMSCQSLVWCCGVPCCSVPPGCKGAKQKVTTV